MRKNFVKSALCLFVATIMLCMISGCELASEFIPKDLCFHSFGEPEVIKEATCNAIGEELYVCKYCGYEEKHFLPTTLHDYDTEYKYNKDGHWISCKNCNSTKDFTGHSLRQDQESCTVCYYVKSKAKGEMSFHFMMLGNDEAGDCVYIKAGNNDILIDGGSNYDSIDDIENYVDKYCTDKTLEFVIVTHADLDHIACFAGSTNGQSLFDKYEVSTIIDFPLSDKTTKAFERYKSERQSEIDDGNSVHYTALECYNNQNGAKRTYDLSDDGSLKLEILYNYFYDHSSEDENNYSVCALFHHGDRQFLFTGDLEKEGEEKLAEKYNFSQVELFKAGHHGSPTSSNEVLLKEIKPKICVACCCAGSVQYTDYLPSTFPSRPFYERISVYTDKIYVPMTVNLVVNSEKPTVEYKGQIITNYNRGDKLEPLHGNIVVISEAGKEVFVECSNEQKVLKDTDWFKNMSVLWEQSPKFD